RRVLQRVPSVSGYHVDLNMVAEAPKGRSSRCSSVGPLLLFFGLFFWTPTAPAATGLRVFTDSVQTISPVAIDEDSNGCLWIAADEGVFRFDGRNFSKVPGAFNTPAGIAVLGSETIIIAANNGVFQSYKGIATQLSTEPANSLMKLKDN